MVRSLQLTGYSQTVVFQLVFPAEKVSFCDLNEGSQNSLPEEGAPLFVGKRESDEGAPAFPCSTGCGS